MSTYFCYTFLKEMGLLVIGIGIVGLIFSIIGFMERK